MIVSSLAVSFIPLAILSLQSQSTEKTIWRNNNLFKNLNIILVRCMLVAVATLALNMTLKIFINQTADNHIFQFVAR